MCLDYSTYERNSIFSCSKDCWSITKSRRTLFYNRSLLVTRHGSTTIPRNMKYIRKGDAAIKAKSRLSTGKVHMIVFWDFRGVLYICFLYERRTINSAYYYLNKAKKVMVRKFIPNSNRTPSLQSLFFFFDKGMKKLPILYYCWAKYVMELDYVEKWVIIVFVIKWFSSFLKINSNLYLVHPRIWF